MHHAFPKLPTQTQRDFSRLNNSKSAESMVLIDDIPSKRPRTRTPGYNKPHLPKSPNDKRTGLRRLQPHRPLLQHRPSGNLMALPRLPPPSLLLRTCRHGSRIIPHPITQIDHPLGRERPPEDYQRQRAEHAGRAQGPLRVHAEPGDGGTFEVAGFAGEGVGFAEGVAEALFEGAVLYGRGVLVRGGVFFCGCECPGYGGGGGGDETWL